ncbi:GNAT family N-acetyltransferase [Nonomuraea sp. SBT364]|uniref:GNAT family N-acetyltransferase n=1 Tax=Nonomuraea sp. SBT364 TaxID=1580530 RepID=UPI000A9FD0F6|nr:GNAT family N-acetyltransferase [Nonomuraea sp. SBT364]
MAVRLRAARAGEAERLSGLAVRSKAYWGYDETFREELRLRPEEVAARRVTVAEGDGRVLGFVTVEGEPPDGELGMLFVEPDAIGGGVGRALYRHALREAGRIGFTRLAIEADPHAVGFYTAMGAELCGPALLVAWPPAPEPSWVAAWTGGRPAAHVGNVAEFNGAPPGPDHYACMAVFAGPLPEVVVLPVPVDEAWIGGLADELGWGGVEVHDGIAPDGAVSAAIARRPALARRLASAAGPVLPWGRTEQFARIVPTPGAVLAAIRRFESKRGAHELFRELAPGHPGIVVPAQRPVGSRRALRRELASGAALVLKTEYGVGGGGTLILNGGARSVARRWTRAGVLVEEYVDGSGPYRDPTFDAVVDAGGDVHPVGTGLMRVEGPCYRGVTTGPGVLPDALAGTAARFGTAVGRALAAHGYRGWYDVDFVTDDAGRLAPTEINLRLTGPAVAFTLRARLDGLRGGRHVVRVLDRLPLGARLPPAALREHLAGIARECRQLGVTFLPTIPSAAMEPWPYVGVAFAARTADGLDRAEAVTRAANEALGSLFTEVARPRRRPPRPRRSSR